MKKLFGVLVLLCWYSTTQAQNLPFLKKDFADSTSIAQHMPILAKQAAERYQNQNKSEYRDNFFRLKLAAQDYAAVQPLLTEMAKEVLGPQKSYIGFGYMYATYAYLKMQNLPTQAAFEQAFVQKLKADYAIADIQNLAWIDMYYQNDTEAEVKQAFQTKLAAALQKEEVSVIDATSLCRSYLSYIVYHQTLKLGIKTLQEINQDKFIMDENVMITLPDGNNISATLVRLRHTTTPQPVVMKYNIYPGNDLASAKEIANKGFVGFVANTRGKRLSTATLAPFEYDAADAYVVLDWISKQPWCNGKIGMYGGSYLGFSQWSAVKKPHPALKTIVPQVAVGVGIDYPMQNGVFMNYALQWIHYVDNNKLLDNSVFTNVEKWNKTNLTYFKEGRAFNTLDAIYDQPNPIFQRWLQHPSYDDYWKNMTPQKQEFANINIPILTITGYYDDDQIGAMSYYREYAKWNKSNQSYLLIGPYSHYGSQGYPDPALNGYTLDEKAVISINDVVFEWFNHTLKGDKLPEILKDKVNYEVMGSNTWKHAPTLEAMHNEILAFHLTEREGKKLLSLQKPKKTTAITQTVDLKDRTEGRMLEETDLNGIAKIIDTVYHPYKHLMVFESDPITEPYAISGMLTANLKVKVNKKDMDVFVQLYEKTADGHYFILNNNLQRASFNENTTERKLLRPNTVETITMNRNFLTCKQLAKGSKIGIAIGINKDPNWQVNYGTGKDVSTETMADAKEPFVIQWLSDSVINIPIFK